MVTVLTTVTTSRKVLKMYLDSAAITAAATRYIHTYTENPRTYIWLMAICLEISKLFDAV